MKKKPNRLRARMRLWAIYNELGYIPWRKPRKPRKARKERRGVYMGAREAIPFLNDDAKRTLSHLVLRPGYMMRDYILRGQHERYLAPFTALLVFYSVFTLLMAVLNPQARQNPVAKSFLDELQNAKTHQVDSTDVDLDVDMPFQFTADSQKSERAAIVLLNTAKEALLLTHLDLYPEAADTPWKESLAAIEGDLRSKGIPLFLGNFLLLWITLALVLRKYKISFSGAAAASAYVLCQDCIFMFLALLFTFGKSADLGLFVLGILLFIDFRQLLGVGNRKALRLTIRTGLIYLGILILFYILLIAGLIMYVILHV